MAAATQTKSPRLVMLALIALALVGLGWLWYVGALAPAPATPDPGLVSRTTYGDGWPLTVDSGQLVCNTDGSILFETADTIYALNGTARGKMEVQHWKDIKAIQAPDPKNQGLFLDLNGLVSRGLTLCK